MKALKARKKYDKEQQQKRFEERKKKREEFLASLSDEEREAYLEKERHKVEERMAFLRGVYGMNIDDPYNKEIIKYLRGSK